MFINFWYPAGKSADIQDKPVKQRMLGQDFVLWRDSAGKVHCLSNTCVHRGGSLAGGKVNGDCMQCPYHGWEFDAEGRCTKIPSLGKDAKIPARARVDAYPTVERYGLVFAFLGDIPEEDRCPIMEIPEFEADGQTLKPGWASTIQHFDWDFDFQRSMENGIDPAHNEFVHPTHGFSGERDDIRVAVENFRWQETEWGTGFMEHRLAPALAEKKMQATSGRTEPGVIEAGTGHHGVSMIWTYIHPTPQMSIHQYLFETPIDEAHTSLYLVNLRNFLIEPADDQRMMERNEYVALQDREILYDVRPVLTPDTNTKEIFTPSDSAVGKYREKLRRWQNRGWRIDVDTVNANSKRVAYAIPCPARRESKGWILDPIPLLPPGSAHAESSDTREAAAE